MKALKKIREDITQAQLDAVEAYADNLLNKYGIEVEFTRHFMDRVNDDRNTPDIVADELTSLFAKIAKNRGKQIKRSKDIEAVIKDVTTNLNLPVVVDFNRRTGEIELVGKTIMRKRKFFTRDKVLRYESAENEENHLGEATFKDDSAKPTQFKDEKDRAKLSPKSEKAVSFWEKTLRADAKYFFDTAVGEAAAFTFKVSTGGSSINLTDIQVSKLAKGPKFRAIEFGNRAFTIQF